MSCTTCGQTEPNIICVDCNPPSIECPQAQPCSSVNSTDCTIYNSEVTKGCHPDEPLMTKGDNVTKILQTLSDYICTHTHIPEDITAGLDTIATAGDGISEVLLSIVDHFQSLYSNLPSPTGATIVDKTHAEMVTLVTAGTLSKGEWYRITDFATMYEQPDYTDATTPVVTPVVKTAAVEPVIVFALSTTQLSPIAFQTAHVKDVIKYELQYTTPVTATPTKGRIIERIDEAGNKTNYDHKNILFKRYLDADGNYSSYYDLGFGSSEFLTFASGFVSHNNIIGNTLYADQVAMIFELPNLVFLDDATDNIFGSPIVNATFVLNARGNKFALLSNVVFKSSCRNNQSYNISDSSFKCSYWDNKIDSINNVTVTATTMESNIIKSFNNNTITASTFNYNSGVIFQNNTITNGGNFNLNEILSLHNNTITGQWYANKFTGEVNNNVCVGLSNCEGKLFTNNVTISTFKLVRMEDGVSSVDFSTATHVYADYTKKIYTNANLDQKLSYYDAYDSEQTALITD